jgi:hypothetical protein
MNERAQELLDNTPDIVFRAGGPVHVLRDLAHLALIHGPPEQPPAITGTTWRWYATDGSPCSTRS